MGAAIAGATDRELLAAAVSGSQAAKAIALCAQVMPRAARRHRIAGMQQHLRGGRLGQRVHIEVRWPASSSAVTMHVWRHRRDRPTLRIDDCQLQTGHGEHQREVAHGHVPPVLDTSDARLRQPDARCQFALVQICQPSRPPYMPGRVERARQDERRAGLWLAESPGHAISVPRASDIPAALGTCPWRGRRARSNSSPVDACKASTGEPFENACSGLKRRGTHGQRRHVTGHALIRRLPDRPRTAATRRAPAARWGGRGRRAR